MKINKLLLSSVLVIGSAFLLSACGAKKTSNTATPTPQANKEFELTVGDRPYISLIPREDGHQLKMVIDRIPSSVKKIEYELIYTAVDQGNEIEKGLGDTLEITQNKIEKDMLLGTESCTAGCKYKYDEGVTGGTISLTLINAQGQVTTYQSPFTLVSSADIKKSGVIALDTENFKVKVFPANKTEFFVTIKNYGLPAGSTAKTAYSVFASSNGKGKVTIETGDNISKADPSVISGDYLIK